MSATPVDGKIGCRGWRKGKQEIGSLALSHWRREASLTCLTARSMKYAEHTVQEPHIQHTHTYIHTHIHWHQSGARDRLDRSQKAERLAIVHEGCLQCASTRRDFLYRESWASSVVPSSSVQLVTLASERICSRCCVAWARSCSRSPSLLVLLWPLLAASRLLPLFTSHSIHKYTPSHRTWTMSEVADEKSNNSESEVLSSTTTTAATTTPASLKRSHQEVRVQVSLVFTNIVSWVCHLSSHSSLSLLFSLPVDAGCLPMRAYTGNSVSQWQLNIVFSFSYTLISTFLPLSSY